MKQQRFAPYGALALNPDSFGLVFELPEVASVELADNADNSVAIVQIRGPLMHHRDFFFDSYEAIKERVAEALAQVEAGTGFVLLSIDSPGGLVSGAFDTARELRKMAEKAGVDLYAHVGAQATSAAYALASAATWIGVSESAQLGSIGVINTLVDVTAQNAVRGINVELVISGERKADSDPNSAIDDGARLATQVRVDDLAGMFFELVVDHGWGRSTEAVAGLEAGIVHGVDAVRLGLATEIATFEQSIAFAMLGATRPGSGATAEQGRLRNMAKATTEEDAVASLRKMAESDDDDEASKAKAALKALGAMGDDDDDDEAKAKAEEEAKAKAEEEEDEAKAKAEEEEAKAKAKAEEDDDPEASASANASANAIAVQALAAVHEIKAERVREKQDAERAELLASRPDFAPELVAVLQTAPMAMVRKTVKTLKRGPARAEAVAEAAAVTGVRGEGQGNGGAARLAPEQSAALSMAMGLTEMCTETVHTPNKMSFGVHRAAAKKGK